MKNVALNIDPQGHALDSPGSPNRICSNSAELPQTIINSPSWLSRLDHTGVSHYEISERNNIAEIKDKLAALEQEEKEKEEE